MLADILSPANYIMVNRDAIKVLGLNTAVYCSELLTIYKKVVNKKKFVNDEKYFNVDRDYIQKQTSLEIDEQLKCDINLSKVNIVKIDEENPNNIYFDIEIFASVLASEDIKLLDKVSKKVKVENPKGTKQASKEHMIQALKDSIECKTPEVLIKMKDWIDTIFASGKGMSKQQVKLFKDKLDDYCNGDLKKALAILDAAIVHAYIDCQWAIAVYEKNTKQTTASTFNRPVINRFGFDSSNSEQKKTTAVSEETY